MGKLIHLFEELWGDTNMGERIENNNSNELSVFDIADLFLTFDSMTQKKLQKLCYYAQAWHLALHDEPLFRGKFEAWVHGPVNPDLYAEYREFKWNPINKIEMEHIHNEHVNDFINQVYNTYGEFTGDELEELTHMEEPWIEARKGLEAWQPSNHIISEKTMQDFYFGVFENSQGE